MEAVLGPDTPQGEGSVAGAGEVGLDGRQLLELGHEPGQRWSYDNGDISVTTVGADKNGTPVFVHCSAQAASILIISVAIRKRRS